MYKKLKTNFLKPIRGKNIASSQYIKYKKALMEINDKLLEKLFQLSALQIQDKEKTAIKKYLKETLSYFKKIEKIDTKNIKPLISPFKPPLTMREDQVLDFGEREKILNQAPQREGSLLKTPSVL